MNFDVKTNPDKQQYFYPNRMGRIVLMAMEEILGRDGVDEVLMQAGLSGYINHYPPNDQDLKFPFMHISQLQAGLERVYGAQPARGLALRVGRACFKYGLREFGPKMGLTDQAFRLLPLQAKLKNGIEALAAIFNTYSDEQVHVESDQATISWQIERCPLCWERHTEATCCHLSVGLLQEALFWLSGGKYFEVEEKQCIACGDSTCTILIQRTPMG